MNTKLALALAISGAAICLSGCSNTAFIGHEESIALATEYKSDPSEPVNLQFGFKERVAVAVPPKQPLTPEQLICSQNVPKKDLLTTVSRFRLNRDKGMDGSAQPGAMLVTTAIATGKAAANVTANGTTTRTTTTIQPNGAQQIQTVTRTPGTNNSAGAAAILDSMHSIMAKTDTVDSSTPIQKMVKVPEDINVPRSKVGTQITTLSDAQALKAFEILHPGESVPSGDGPKTTLAGELAGATTLDQIQNIAKAVNQASK